MRWLRHLFAPSARGRFPEDRLQRIAAAIAASELDHGGEVVFAVESRLPLAALWAGMTPGERAREAFARLRVWDTDGNNGVLLYLLLADHAIELVADRGLHACVSSQEWEQVCAEVSSRLKAGDMERAVVEGIGAISTLLARHFPAAGQARDELPDRPVLL